MPLKTITAKIDSEGNVHLDEPLQLDGPRRALVTILEDAQVLETALLSEQVLAQDWLVEEEESAWNSLQKDP